MIDKERRNMSVNTVKGTLSRAVEFEKASKMNKDKSAEIKE